MEPYSSKINKILKEIPEENNPDINININQINTDNKEIINKNIIKYHKRIILLYNM